MLILTISLFGENLEDCNVINDILENKVAENFILNTYYQVMTF
jgi:hypothetical protein